MPINKEDKKCDAKRSTPILVLPNTLIPIAEIINAGLLLFTKESKIQASSLLISFFSYRVFTDLLPDGKPHRYPIIIAIDEFLEVLKNLLTIFLNKLAVIFNISVFIANSDSIKNGSSEGIRDESNTFILNLTDA